MRACAQARAPAHPRDANRDGVSKETAKMMAEFAAEELTMSKVARAALRFEARPDAPVSATTRALRTGG